MADDSRFDDDKALYEKTMMEDTGSLGEKTMAEDTGSLGEKTMTEDIGSLSEKTMSDDKDKTVSIFAAADAAAGKITKSNGSDDNAAGVNSDFGGLYGGGNGAGSGFAGSYSSSRDSDIEEYRKYEPFFGTYYLKRRIGSGSFGKVYEIAKKDGGDKYKAALKIISIPQNEDDIYNRLDIGTDRESLTAYYDSVLEELMNEIDIMISLKGNSNIVSYEDHQKIPHESGIGYDLLIKMELLTPLKGRLSPMREEDVVRLGIDICKALELCHEKNIIHRDIKPSNIFISDSGEYKLGDFGIARTMERTTRDMSRKGTFNYMAPEVYKGAGYYDMNVDTYSLGLVMYYLLNNRHIPFIPSDATVITHQQEESAFSRRIMGEPLPQIRGVRDALDRIIRKACAYDPRDRYSSAAEMRFDLENYYSINYRMSSGVDMGGAADVLESMRRKTSEFTPAATGSYNVSDQLGRGGIGGLGRGGNGGGIGGFGRGGNGGGDRRAPAWLKWVAIGLAVLLVAVIGIALAGRSGGDTAEEQPDTAMIPEDAVAYEGHHYKVFNDSMLWQEARVKCEEMGGHLATITSQAEQNFIVMLIENDGVQKHHYWLGGTDEDVEGTWTWITGEEWTYDNWEGRQPNNSTSTAGEVGEDYLDIQTTKPENDPEEYMTWMDICNEGIALDYRGDPEYCDTPYFGYICEWEY